jgi:hypothetical protein
MVCKNIRLSGKRGSDANRFEKQYGVCAGTGADSLSDGDGASKPTGPAGGAHTTAHTHDPANSDEYACATHGHTYRHFDPGATHGHAHRHLYACTAHRYTYRDLYAGDAYRYASSH